MSKETKQAMRQRIAALEKKNKRLALAALVVLLILAMLLAAFLSQRPKDAKMEPNVVVGIMPGKTEEQLEAELNRQVSEKIIDFSINSKPTFASGTAAGNILFENPASSEKLTRLELFRDDTGEMIYSTGLLEPGTYVPQDTLSVALEAGAYTCTGYIYAYKMDAETYIGKVAVGLTLTVEN